MTEHSSETTAEDTDLGTVNYFDPKGRPCPECGTPSGYPHRPDTQTPPHPTH
jgi:hypothetical protein